MNYALMRDFPLLEAALIKRGWKRTFDDDWNLFWGWSAPGRPSSAEGTVRTNHFTGSEPLHGKELQAAMLRCTPEETFAGVEGARAPATFVLPRDSEALVAAASKSPKAVWISKPLAGSCGRGIHLIAPGASFPLHEDVLVQRYLEQPHLLDGHRYTLRIWIVVLSLDPFVVYICRRGLTKRAATPYRQDSESYSDKVMHLTNSDVQKGASNGLMPLLSLDEYERYLQREGHNYSALWDEVRTACARAVLMTRQGLLDRSAWGSANHAPFELFGFDLIIDSDLKPWVIEMNRNPDMRAVWGTSGLEAEIKEAVLGELIDLAYRRDGEPLYPLAQGSWQLLFPHVQAGAWKEDWMPTARDRELFLSHGLQAPDVCGHGLLRDACFVDDGAVLFSADRREFLTMNDSAAMLALRNDDGEVAEEAAIPVLERIWSCRTHGIYKDQPEMLTRTVPLYEAAQEEWFLLADILVRCSVPSVCDDLGRLLARATRQAEPAETVYVILHAGQVRVLSRLGTASMRESLAVSGVYSAALLLLCERPACQMHVPGTVVRQGARASIFFGLPFRGKSTLAAALALENACLLSDGVVQVDAGGRVLPLPVPLRLREDAVRLLEEVYPGFPSTVAREVHEGQDGRLIFLPVESDPVPVGRYVFVQLRPGEETRLTPLGVCETLKRLQESGMVMSRSTTKEDAYGFLDTLIGCERYDLVVGSLQDAVRLLQL